LASIPLRRWVTEDYEPPQRCFIGEISRVLIDIGNEAFSVPPGWRKR
jgi:hypothetical protein